MKKLIFGFFLKTYINDIKYVERLIKSFNRFNCDDIKMVLMCPKSDSHQFQKLVSKNQNITIYEEEILIEFLIDEQEIKNFNCNSTLGYLNQSLLKLCFWELGIFENYFCIDSEFVFIDDFYLKDFLTDDNIPYTFLNNDNEFKVDPKYYFDIGYHRKKSLNKIKKYLDLDTNIYLTNHGHCTFSAKVLKDFKSKVLIKNEISYKELLRISEYEFSWYNFYLQKIKLIEIIVREPFFKLFIDFYSYNEYLTRSITIEDIKRGYKGYLINSNFSRDSGVLTYGEKNFKPTIKIIITSAKNLLRLIFNKFFLR